MPSSRVDATRKAAGQRGRWTRGYIKALKQQEARAEAFSRAREYDSRRLLKQKRRSKTKANHGFDHVDDRPRARDGLRAQGVAPLVARKAAPPLPK